MTETEIKAVLRSRIDAAAGAAGGEIAAERRKLMAYYLGKPFGNEIEGRSAVVSTDVADTIESVLPDLMQIFAASDEVVAFEPTGPEDEAFARQATEYVNHVFSRDNDGFRILYDWIKDALLQINGIVKVRWDDSTETKRHFYSGLDEDAMLAILAEPGVEPLAHTAFDAAGREVATDAMDAADAAPGPLRHDLRIARTDRRGRVAIENVPPEEFLIDRRAASIDDAAFVCHRTTKTPSELIAMGFAREAVDRLPTEAGPGRDVAAASRRGPDAALPGTADAVDRSMREIEIHDCYLRIDRDGDGMAELRQIVAAGPGLDLLHDEEVDHLPFVSLTPIPMPHRFHGRALAELVADLQLLKSTVWRQLLDNVYNVNNARALVNDRVDLDDYLNNLVGHPIRVDGAGPVGDSYAPLPTASIAHEVYPLLEYCDTVRELRTGVTRYGQGLDAESLNRTAAGIDRILGRQQQRILLIARIFAETGIKTLFGKILRLTVENQDRARIVRLRNRWEPVDPKAWNADMDVSVRVGIGHGTRDQRLAGLRTLLDLFERVIALQGGAAGPLVDLDKVHALLARLIEELGFKSADAFLLDPKSAPGAPSPPPAPDPALVAAEAAVRRKRFEAEAEAALDRDKAMWAFQLEAWKAGAALQLEREAARAAGPQGEDA